MVFSDQEIPFFAAKRRSSLTKINNPEALGQQRLQVLAGGMQKSGGRGGRLFASARSHRPLRWLVRQQSRNATVDYNGFATVFTAPTFSAPLSSTIGC